jgi:hypothetical protein
MKMKLVIGALALVAGSAYAECSSVDQVISDAAAGKVVTHTEFDFSPSMAVAAAYLCRLDEMKFPMCDVRIGLLTYLHRGAEQAFELGETTRTTVSKLQQRLDEAKVSCGE